MHYKSRTSHIRYYARQTFLAFLYRTLKRRYIQRFVLPNASVAKLEGVRLEISGLSCEMKEVIIDGRYESPEVSICKSFIRPGDRILEIGGAIGFVGLYCLTQLKAAQVVSVEPNPHTASLLRRNYQINGLTPTLIEAAVGKRDEKICLRTSPAFWTDSILSQSEPSNYEMINVQALSLKSLFSRVATGFTAMVIDAEGAECFIDWADVPLSVRTIILEIHPLILGHGRAYQVLTDAINSGFQVENRKDEVVALSRRIS